MRILALLILLSFPLKGEDVKQEVLNEAVNRCVLIESENSQGTGVILKTNVIVTVAHLGGAHIFVNGYPVEIHRRLNQEDLMSLKAPTGDFKEAKIGLTMRQGETIFYVGNPGKHRKLVATGTIVDIANDRLYADFHATFGASGSGVWNLKGELIGLISAVEVSDGIDYAIIIPVGDLIQLFK